MRFRTGVVVGFGFGYYLGAKAGRKRFEQIDRLLRRIGGAESVDVATQKARAVLDLGVERARDLVESSSPTPPGGTAPGRGPRRPPADPSLN